jgi:hypothetical protein
MPRRRAVSLTEFVEADDNGAERSSPHVTNNGIEARCSFATKAPPVDTAPAFAKDLREIILAKAKGGMSRSGGGGQGSTAVGRSAAGEEENAVCRKNLQSEGAPHHTLVA